MADFNADLTLANEAPLSTEFDTSVSPAPRLLNNAITGNFGRGGAIVKTSEFTFAADQSAKITVGTASGTSDDLGVMLRGNAVSGGNGYAIYWDSGTSRLFVLEYTNGSFSIVKLTTTLTMAATDTLEAIIEGTTITVKKNGSTIDTITDSTHSTGQAGVFCNEGGNSDISAFEASDVGGAPVTGIEVLRRRIGGY